MRAMEQTTLRRRLELVRDVAEQARDGSDSGPRCRGRGPAPPAGSRSSVRARRRRARAPRRAARGRARARWRRRLPPRARRSASRTAGRPTARRGRRAPDRGSHPRVTPCTCVGSGAAAPSCAARPQPERAPRGTAEPRRLVPPGRGARSTRGPRHRAHRAGRGFPAPTAARCPAPRPRPARALGRAVMITRSGVRVWVATRWSSERVDSSNHCRSSAISTAGPGDTHAVTYSSAAFDTSSWSLRASDAAGT